MTFTAVPHPPHEKLSTNRNCLQHWGYYRPEREDQKETRPAIRTVAGQVMMTNLASGWTAERRDVEHRGLGERFATRDPGETPAQFQLEPRKPGAPYRMRIAHLNNSAAMQERRAGEAKTERSSSRIRARGQVGAGCTGERRPVSRNAIGTPGSTGIIRRRKELDGC